MSKADENYKRLRAELDEQLSKDKRLMAIADKIAKGTADFSDTARYTQIVSKHMSDVIKRNIGELKQPMAKEMVCKELLRDHYELINGVFGEVQVSVDEKLGIHLNPIKPAYPAERVDKWAHSLEDPTVEQSVIERRAASGSENIGNSIHDDCIKENAKWREQAGLDCYLTRDAGGGCCPWCATLEGRYSYADAPDDIFRRHDNCTCTVTYECGRKRQDVWSKKTWEADPKDVEARIAASEAAKPTVKTPAEAEAINEQSKSNITVLSKEQAEALNEQNKPIVLTEAEAKEREAQILGKGDNVNNKSVDKPEESGIIHSIGDPHGKSYEPYNYEPRVTKDVRTRFNEEFNKAEEKYGKISTVKGVFVLNDNSSDEGTYNDNSGFISLRHAEKKNGLKEMERIAHEKYKDGKWSSSNPNHVMRHEIGHAIQAEHQLNDLLWEDKKLSILGIMQKATLGEDGYSMPSSYASNKLSEFISECIAASFVKKQSKTVRDVVKIIIGGV